ncbi:uncharacterized protein AMSG_11214 [Thecamonas trahens ATCC 50062]|uniref:FYVE-type domain-containing protein n=1 Tax=Thecamonas trahens ATCC 50062 TaxID=461836 RepID=A0A0L0DUP3_THETB|nr:hypothetical protein AMSG_11214 [Thecamonas trahens ATCC 50062]KNC55781.1 hypothetical protein AMSG_11214 [Thecamonas trahens ATCC 50062]|eukprot:XP_013752863.1 hypothetical protein AMSG_11214 [Thecamonas trahens ATCC 50062]
MGIETDAGVEAEIRIDGEDLRAAEEAGDLAGTLAALAGMASQAAHAGAPRDAVAYLAAGACLAEDVLLEAAVIEKSAETEDARATAAAVMTTLRSELRSFQAAIGVVMGDAAGGFTPARPPTALPEETVVRWRQRHAALKAELVSGLAAVLETPPDGPSPSASPMPDEPLPLPPALGLASPPLPPAAASLGILLHAASAGVEALLADIAAACGEALGVHSVVGSAAYAVVALSPIATAEAHVLSPVAVAILYGPGGSQHADCLARLGELVAMGVVALGGTPAFVLRESTHSPVTPGLRLASGPSVFVGTPLQFAQWAVHHRVVRPLSLLGPATADARALLDSAVELQSAAVDAAVEVGTSPPRAWVPDAARSACALCVASFGFLRRRHHCRQCGEVVCASCSPQRKPLPKLGLDKAVRVCRECAPHPLPMRRERHDRALAALSVAVVQFAPSVWHVAAIDGETVCGGPGRLGTRVFDAHTGAWDFVHTVLDGLALYAGLAGTWTSTSGLVEALVEDQLVSPPWALRVSQLVAALAALRVEAQVFHGTSSAEMTVRGAEASGVFSMGRGLRAALVHAWRVLLPLREWVEAFVLSAEAAAGGSPQLDDKALYDESPRPVGAVALLLGEYADAQEMLAPLVELNPHVVFDLGMLVAALRWSGAHDDASARVAAASVALSAQYKKSASRMHPTELRLLAERLAQVHELEAVLALSIADGRAAVEAAAAAYALRTKHLGPESALTVLSGLWGGVIEARWRGMDIEPNEAMVAELVAGVEFLLQTGAPGAALAARVAICAARALVACGSPSPAVDVLARVLESVAGTLPRLGVQIAPHVRVAVLEAYARYGGASPEGAIRAAEQVLAEQLSPELAVDDAIGAMRWARPVLARGAIGAACHAHAVYYSVVVDLRRCARALRIALATRTLQPQVVVAPSRASSVSSSFELESMVRLPAAESSGSLAPEPLPAAPGTPSSLSGMLAAVDGSGAAQQRCIVELERRLGLVSLQMGLNDDAMDLLENNVDDLEYLGASAAELAEARAYLGRAALDRGEAATALALARGAVDAALQAYGAHGSLCMWAGALECEALAVVGEDAELGARRGALLTAVREIGVDVGDEGAQLAWKPFALPGLGLAVAPKILAARIGTEGRAYMRLATTAASASEAIRFVKLALPLLRVGLGVDDVCVAEAHELLGCWLRASGLVAEAYAHFEAAYAVYIGLWLKRGTEKLTLGTLVAAHEHVACALLDLDKPEAALAVFTMALGYVEVGTVAFGSAGDNGSERVLETDAESDETEDGTRAPGAGLDMPPRRGVGEVDVDGAVASSFVSASFGLGVAAPSPLLPPSGTTTTWWHSSGARGRNAVALSPSQLVGELIAEFRVHGEERDARCGAERFHSRAMCLAVLRMHMARVYAQLGEVELTIAAAESALSAEMAVEISLRMDGTFYTTLAAAVESVTGKCTFAARLRNAEEQTEVRRRVAASLQSM